MFQDGYILIFSFNANLNAVNNNKIYQHETIFPVFFFVNFSDFPIISSK